MTDIKRLNEADALISETAREFGLDFMPQEFDVVPVEKMMEIVAYRLPVNFSHWSFGRDYESERTKFEHGFAVPYEVVFNSDPCRAYLMESNPFAIQVMVMAHVYAHNDFMKNNLHFRGTRRDMVTSASEAASRFRGYEEAYGMEQVEGILDAGMSIQWNIDPDEELHKLTENEERERLYGWKKSPPAKGSFDDLIPRRPEISREEKEQLRRKTPPEPTPELLGYIINHSPKPLKDWERDVLQVLKEQAQYFMPYRRTKIMNEGWATFWHERIIGRLLAEGFLEPSEHGLYNIYNARVKAHHPRVLNPYLLGSALFSDIEERWNKGRFGRDFEDEVYARKRELFDTGLMKGREKIFSVRKTHMDWFFIDEFLSPDMIEKLCLYTYEEKETDTHNESVIAETEWRKIKSLLVRSLMNWGVPRILVVDGNYMNSLQLYLKHDFESLPLEEEYCRKTLEYIFRLWSRPVHLETQKLSGDNPYGVVYTCDEDGVRERAM